MLFNNHLICNLAKTNYYINYEKWQYVRVIGSALTTREVRFHVIGKTL